MRLSRDRVEAFLIDSWGGWDVCLHTANYSDAIIVELVKLCRMGVTKQNAKVKLKEQIVKRRVGKTSRLPKGPKLQKADVRNIISQITDQLQKPTYQKHLNTFMSNKRKRSDDFAYSGSKDIRRGLKVVIKSKVFVNNTSTLKLSMKNDISKQSNDDLTAEEDASINDIEVSRRRITNSSDFDNSPTVSPDSLANSFSSTDPYSIAPFSPPVVSPSQVTTFIKASDSSPYSRSSSTESFSSDVLSQRQQS